MKIIPLIILLLSAGSTLAEPGVTTTASGDGAITKVENCVCYKSPNAPEIKPWEIDWDDTELMRKLISHCVCQAQIDIQKVQNPRRYIVPGAELK